MSSARHLVFRVLARAYMCLARSSTHRYVLAVFMSTMADTQKVSFEFDSEAEASGYFTLRIGDGEKTATIPYDAVRYYKRANNYIAISGSKIGMVRNECACLPHRAIQADCQYFQADHIVGTTLPEVRTRKILSIGP